MQLIRIVAGAAFAISSMTAGGNVLAQPASDAACISNFEVGVDYFGAKVETEYAENFSVSYHESYKVVRVEQPFVGGAAEVYVLLQCGAPLPELEGDLADAPVIQVPVPTMFSASTTHLPALEALGEVDRVTGVATLAYATTEPFLNAGENGTIIEYASTGSPDIETIIDAAPSIYMTGGGDDPAHDTIRAAGIPVVANAEWLESSLLGRAEWLKFIALFFNDEAEATVIFDEIETSFNEAAQSVADIVAEDRPLVLAGSGFQGVFYAPGGRSYVAEAIAAAGGTYVFNDDDGTASLSFPDLEIILDRAGDADVWINSATTYRTLADIEADDPRLAGLPVAQAGNVWNYDRIATDAGGVAFFELGVLRPDYILRDLIEIFHPGTLDGHEFVFYRPIAIE